MASEFMCKKSQNTQTFQCQNFFLKMQSLREGRELLLLVVTPSSAPSKQVTLHPGHFPLTPSNPLYVP